MTLLGYEINHLNGNCEIDFRQNAYGDLTSVTKTQKYFKVKLYVFFQFTTVYISTAQSTKNIFCLRSMADFNFPYKISLILPWIWNEVCLKFRQIHVECSVEAERGRDGGHYLSDDAVQVRVGGSFNVQIPAADIVNGFIVHHKSAIRMFQSRMRGQNGVIGLDYSSRHLGQKSKYYGKQQWSTWKI